jgi:hypothetical protein
MKKLAHGLKIAFPPSRLKLLACAALSVILWSANAWAQTSVELRGRVDSSNRLSKATYPLQGTSVKLYSCTSGRSRLCDDLKSTTYTGTDGLYYFREVPPGAYLIVIEEGRLKIPLEVDGRYRGSTQDVGPVLLRRQ